MTPPGTSSAGNALWIAVRLGTLLGTAWWGRLAVEPLTGSSPWMAASSILLAVTASGTLLALALRGLRVAKPPDPLSLSAAIAIMLLGFWVGQGSSAPTPPLPLTSSPSSPAPSQVPPSPTAETLPTPMPPAPGPAHLIPYEPKGGGMVVSVRINGRGPFSLLWDTGASYSTVNRDTLSRLGLPVPKDGPKVTLQTASGEDSARALVLQEISAGGAEAKGIVALHCEPCAHDGVVGLLGNNFASRWETTIDPQEQVIRLQERDGPFNQADELRPFVDLDGKVWKMPGGRTRVEVTVKNRSPKLLQQVTILVSPQGGGEQGAFTLTLPQVPAGGEARTQADDLKGVPTSLTLELMEVGG